VTNNVVEQRLKPRAADSSRDDVLVTSGEIGVKKPEVAISTCRIGAGGVVMLGDAWDATSPALGRRCAPGWLNRFRGPSPDRQFGVKSLEPTPRSKLCDSALGQVVLASYRRTVPTAPRGSSMEPGRFERVPHVFERLAQRLVIAACLINRSTL
jgi:hypothetical protein